MAIDGDSWKFYNPVTSKDGEIGGLISPGGGKYLFGPGERLGSGFTVITGNGSEKKVEEWILSNRISMNETLMKIDPILRKTYLAIIEDYPILTMVDVVGRRLDTNDAPGSFRAPTKDQPKSTVIVNENPRIDYEWLFANREISIALIAKQIGIDIRVLRKNPKILATFFLAHEFGHSLQYQKKLRDGYPDPTQKWRDTRAEEMRCFTYPGKKVSELRHMHKKGLLEPEFNKYRNYFNSKGIYTINQLFDRAEAEYREMPQEKYADEFASRIMRRHWRDLGLDQLTGIRSPGIR